MTSEIDKLKHFHVENYSGTNFTDDLNDGEEFLYTTIRCKDDKEVTLLCKYVKNKHIGNCPNCIFNKYLCYGLLCNIVVLKVIKDEEKCRYFSICLLQQHDINKGWMPKPTQIIDCVKVEISPDNWIMAVDINNIDLIKLDINYNIQWEECSCLKGIRLEDVTEELEDKAYEEMRHN